LIKLPNTKSLGIGSVVALAVANPALAVIGLIFGGVLFAILYTTLVIFGLVSALVYGAFGLILVWLIGSFSKTWLEAHGWIVLIIPVFFVFGWFSDRMGSLGLNLLSFTKNQVVISHDAWVPNGGAVAMYGSVIVAVLMFFGALLVIATFTALRKN
jgi:hypothetical protein